MDTTKSLDNVELQNILLHIHRSQTSYTYGMSDVFNLSHYTLFPASIDQQVVPHYYLRLNKDGYVENSTCMNNTACEHYMVDRLIVDDLKHWAVNYKVFNHSFALDSLCRKLALTIYFPSLC